VNNRHPHIAICDSSHPTFVLLRANPNCAYATSNDLKAGANTKSECNAFNKRPRRNIMYSSKFKNSGSFATSATASALVIGIHFAGVQLLVADRTSLQNEVVSQTAAAATEDPVRRVVQIEGFVVTASRL